MTNAVLYAYVALLGLCLGSFINVVILRDDKRKSILTGRSECMHCHHGLAWYDLIPVLSFLSLRARCRYCGKRLSWQYPLVEVTASLLAVFALWTAERSMLGWQAAVGLGIACLIFLAISVIDIRTLMIPVEYCVAAGVIGALGMLAAHALPLGSVLLGALVGGGIIAIILYGWKLVFKQEGMGTGDIWVAAAIGAVTGYPLVWAAIISAFMIGAVVGIALMGLRHKNLETALPFGPFLFAGLLFALTWGQMLLRWYIL